MTYVTALIIAEIDAVSGETSEPCGTTHVVAEVRTSAVNTCLTPITDHTLTRIYT